MMSLWPLGSIYKYRHVVYTCEAWNQDHKGRFEDNVFLTFVFIYLLFIYLFISIFKKRSNVAYRMFISHLE